MIIFFNLFILILLLFLIVKKKNKIIKKKNVIIDSDNTDFIRFYISNNCHNKNISVIKSINILKNINNVLYSSKNKNNIMLIPKLKMNRNDFDEIISDKTFIKDMEWIQIVKKSLHPHVFLINLKKSRERLEFMKNKLKDIHLSVQLVEAIDGYQLKHKIASTNKSLGAYGLLLTYEKLLRYAIEKNLPEIFILEDDIYFHKNFNNLFKQYQHLMEDKDIIYLGTSQSELPEIKSHFYNMNDKFYTYGTYGIILKRKFINILYHALRNKEIDIDVLINILYRRHSFDLKTIIFYPPLILPEVRDSLNMGKRKFDDFLKQRKLWKFKNDFESINKYSSFIQKNNEKTTTNDNKFCFIVPSYNNEEWIEKNLKSIIFQNYTNYHIYYTNDNSSDNTLKKLHDFIDEYNLDNKMTVYNNFDRKYQGLSRYQMYMNANIKDEDILIFLDGDDFLYNSNVLNVLNDIYKKGYEMTYGQFIYWTKENKYEGIGGNKSFPIDIIKNKAYRQYPFITQHLRTVKKKIIKDINEENFYDWNNDIITSCTDLIESFHCLEKTNKHTNSNEILLVYNKTNSLRYENSYYRKEKKEFKKKIEEYIRNNYEADH